MGKVHNGQKEWLCSPRTNNTDPFTHIATQCRPCGNYWGNEYVVKEIGETGTRMEAPLSPTEWSTYSHGQVRSEEVQR